MPEYILLKQPCKLEEFCASLAGEQELALDLEADSLHHYREKVCLLQLSNRRETWLLDPLLVRDLSPLAPLLADPQRLVVLHGGDYDIRSLHRDFGISIGRMFDTMIAAQFCGITEFGLAALLRTSFGIELDKRFQKADWSRRPLTPEMADYAAHDTAHLLDLADQLRGRLQRLGRLDWVAEECSLVVKNRMTEKGDGPLFINCKGAGKLKPRNLAILEGLLQLRDRLARELDRPAFKIMPSEALLKLAEVMPKEVREIGQIPGLTPRLLGRFGEQLLESIRQAQQLPERSLPRYPRSTGEPNPGIKARIARLKTWRGELANRLELATGLLAPNWLLERIAEQRPTSREQLAAISGVRNWQLQLWGDDLLRLMMQEPTP
mgnify:CR=1 FL=1